jgi:hypothetical protein
MLVSTVLPTGEPLKAAEETGGFNAGCHQYSNEESNWHEADDFTPKYKNMHVGAQAGLCNVHNEVD